MLCWCCATAVNADGGREQGIRLSFVLFLYFVIRVHAIVVLCFGYFENCEMVICINMRLLVLLFMAWQRSSAFKYIL